MSTIANAKIEHNYNRYNGYFFGCLHMMNFCNSYHTNGKITRVTTIITVMAAYSNERVAAIILSVLYRMLTFLTYIYFYRIHIPYNDNLLSYILIRDTVLVKTYLDMVGTCQFHFLAVTEAEGCPGKFAKT